MIDLMQVLFWYSAGVVSGFIVSIFICDNIKSKKNMRQITPEEVLKKL